MVKQGQEKLTLWKDSNIIPKILYEVLFQEQQKRYFDIQKILLMKKLLLWLEQAISKYIMRLFLIY